ncbi:hypothetical protein ACA910_016523 [Epithemia clementina (nom. ined.)]
MNNQRRIFRGRGGPNDRRLPKHNARRRRPHPSVIDGHTTTANLTHATVEVEIDCHRQAHDSDIHVVVASEQEAATALINSWSHDNETNQLQCSADMSSDDGDDTDSDDNQNDHYEGIGESHVGDATAADLIPGHEDSNALSVEDDKFSVEGEKLVGDLNNNVLDDDDNDKNNKSAALVQSSADDHYSLDNVSNVIEDSKFNTEIQHLLKRIKHNRESFSQAKNEGLYSLDSYQMNVLNAVENCVDEWKGIWRHYNNKCNDSANGQTPVETIEEHHVLGLSPTLLRQVGQALFELLQQALQCGPLSGSNPGYFKRCGSQVATMVHAFLFRILATPQEASNVWHLTDKQAAAIETWKTAALKAAESNKPPSKSVLSKQAEAEKHRQRKEELQEKKKIRRNKKK